MPIPHKPKGFGPNGGGISHHTRYQQKWMGDLETSLPDWYEDAECSAYGADLFMISDMDGRDVEDFKKTQKKFNAVDLWSFNDRKVGEAKKICSGCLVKTECQESASVSDREFTVRGGLTPLSHTAPPGRPKKNTTPASNFTAEELYRNGKACIRGHSGSWRYSRSKWTCKDCEKLSRDNKFVAAPPRALSETCQKGHNNWANELGSESKRYCRTCKRAATRRRREAKRDQG